MSKALRFLQIAAEHQDCPSFTVYLTIKTSSQNISITLLQISLKLHEHRGRYWRKKLPWTILEEQFPVPRYTAASKIGNSVISLLWQLRCRCNPDHNKFSSLSNTTVVAIFPKLCFWRRSLCSNLGGIGPEKLYRATLRLPRYGYPQRVTCYMTYMGGRGAINRGTATVRGNTIFRARCFFNIFSSLIFAVTQMQMMRVLEPQDQMSVLVIRVIEEVLVQVGKYILALRLVRSHFICIMNRMRKSLSLSS